MTTSVRKSTLAQIAATLFVATAALVSAPVSAQSSGPQVSLFPRAVTAELAVTRDAAREMENGMSEIVKRMQKQKELYANSNCEGDASGSVGCNQIISQLSDSYITMLDKMAETLPEVKQSVQNTEKMLQKRIATELGRKQTPDQLQKALLNDGRDVRQPYQGPTTSGRSMSSIFERQFRMISQNQGQSMMSMASEIYLDMRAASGWVERLEAQLIRQKQIAELQVSAGTLTPEMDSTIAEVTAMVLGEGNEGILLEAPAVDNPENPLPAAGSDRFTM